MLWILLLACAQGDDYVEGRVDLQKPFGLQGAVWYPKVVWTVKTPFDRSSPSGLARAWLSCATFSGRLMAELARIQKEAAPHYREIERVRILSLVDEDYYKALMEADPKEPDIRAESTGKEPGVTEKTLSTGEVEITVTHELKVTWGDKTQVMTDYKRLTCARSGGKWVIAKIESGYDKKGEFVWTEEAPFIHAAYWAIESDSDGPPFEAHAGTAKTCAEAFLFDLRLELRVIRDREQRALAQGLIPILDELFDPALLKKYREKVKEKWEEKLKKQYRPRTPKSEEENAGGVRFLFPADNFLGDSVGITVKKGAKGWRVIWVEKFEEKAEKKGGQTVLTPVWTPAKTWSELRELALLP